MPDDSNDFWSSGKSADKSKPAKPNSGLRTDAPKDTANFWGKSTEPTSSPTADSGVWTQAAKAKERDQAEREALLKDPALPAKRRKRIVRNVLLGIGGTVLLALIVGVLFLPQIAGAIAPGYVKSAAGEAIQGSVSIDDMSLSWSGPQQVKGVRLLDPKGKEVARLAVRVDKGLIDLATGGANVGPVTVTGLKADIVRGDDGTTNLEQAIAPRTQKKSKAGESSKSSPPPQLPKDLNVKLAVKDIDVTYVDKSAPANSPVAVTVRHGSLDASVVTGRPLDIQLIARAAPGIATGSGPEGSIDLKARVEKWTRSDGTVDANAASGDIKLAITDLPTQLVDAFVPPRQTSAGPAASLRESLGDAIRATITATGSAEKGGATIDVATANATVKGQLALADRVISLAAPLLVQAKSQAVKGLAPEVMAVNAPPPPAQAGQPASRPPDPRATIDTVPDITITVDTLRLPLGKENQVGQDLRGGALAVTIATTEASGKVRLRDDEPPKPFRISPLNARVQSDDLAKDVKVTAGSSATIDGQPAGTLDVNLTASGLLDGAGKIKPGMPGQLAGRASLRGVATAIAQPFINLAEIDLPRDIGPTLDVELVAGADAKSDSQRVDVHATAEKLSIAGTLERTPQKIGLLGDGLRIEAASAGAIASRFVKPETGWRLSSAGGQGAGGGRTVILLKTLTIPTDAGSGALKLDQTAATASLELDGLALTPVEASGAPRIGVPPAPVRVDTLKLGMQLRPGGDAQADLVSGFGYMSDTFDASGSFDVKKLLVAKPAASGPGTGVEMAPPLSLRPQGRLFMNNLPATLVGLFVTPPAAPATGPATGPAPARTAGAQPAPADAAKPAMDLPRLLAGTLGGPVNLVIETKPVANNAEAIDLAVRAKAARLEAEAGGVLQSTQAALRATSIVTTISPETLDAVLREFAPSVADSAGGARLAGPSRLRVDVDPIVVPIDAAKKPQLDRIGMAKVTLSLPGQTLVDGLKAKNEDGTSRDLGRLGVEDFRVVANVPVSALLGPSRPEDKLLKATLAGQVLGRDARAIMDLEGDLTAEIQRGTLSGPLSSNIRLARISTTSLEAIAGKPGLLTGILGDRAQIDLGVQMSPPQAADAPPSAIDATLSIAAPLLTSEGPISVSITPERLELKRPARLVIKPDRDAVNRLLASGQQGQPGAKPSMQLRELESVAVSLSQLSLPRTEKGGSAPVVAAELSIPRVALAGSDGTPVSLSQTVAKIQTEAPRPVKNGPPEGPPVSFSLDVSEAAVGDQPPAKGMALTGAVTGLFDAKGGLSQKTALLAAQGRLPAVPTAVVDALANQKGLLVEALGSIVSVDLNIERYPLDPAVTPANPPLIDFKLLSPRASVAVRGSTRGPVFVSERPLEITITEMTQALGSKFLGITPLLGSLEKTPKDAPALITANNLTLGLDGDISKLNADIRADPGEARFGTSSAFAGILKVLQQKTTGTIGRRLEPLEVQVRSGVATYNRWRVPVGEFSLESEGTVDLVRKQMDVVTWVPFGALSDQAAGSLNTGLGSLVGRAVPPLETVTMVPFRTQGPTDNPETKADLQLLGKNLVKTLRPDELIKRGLKDLLDRPK